MTRMARPGGGGGGGAPRPAALARPLWHPCHPRPEGLRLTPSPLADMEWSLTGGLEHVHPLDTAQVRG
jgi:hypothetical protein